MNTFEPLPGVICPACRLTPVNGPIQQFQWQHGAWACPTCQLPYPDACKQAHAMPRYRDEKNQSPLPTEKKEDKMTTQSTQPSQPAPDVLSLSHSQLETWQQCQLRWRLDKVDRVEKAPSEALIFGTALHAALEADGKQAMRGWKLEDYELLGEFDIAFTAELLKCDPNGRIPKARHVAMRARAQDIITKYIALVQPAFHPLAVEEDFSFDLAADLRFRGRIDAITGASIVDWKTANKPWMPGDQHHKDQATAYLIAKPDAQRVSFAVFSGTGDDCRFQSLSTTRTDEQKALYRAKVLRIASEIRAAKASGDFRANPGPLCGWCDVLGACTAGQAWLKVQGRVPQVPVIQAKVEMIQPQEEVTHAND